MDIWSQWKVNNNTCLFYQGGLPWWLKGKESACSEEDSGSVPGWEDPLEKEMATHSSFVAWEIPWTEEPGWLLPIGLQRVRYDWAAKQPQQSTTFYQDAKAHYLLYIAKTGPEIFCCAHTASNLWGLEADSRRVQASSLRARLWAGGPAAKTMASWCA